MSPEKGTSLALAVIRSWSATGFALHRLTGFIAGNFVASGLGVYGFLLVSLQIMVTNMKDGAGVGPINNKWLSATEALVSVLFEVGAWSGQRGNLPSNMLSQTFDACMDLCMSHHSRDSQLGVCTNDRPTRE
jgi:hypothetical protein